MIKVLIVAMIFLATFSFSGTASTTIRPTVSLDYEMEPEVFMPGDIGTITVTLKNMASGEIYVEEDDETLDMNAYIASGSLNGNGKLEILDQSYTNIGMLGPGDNLRLTFNIKVKDNVATGVHYADLKIIGGSNMYDLNYRIPVKVDERNVKLIVSNLPSTLMNEVSTISVDVVNRRPNDVKSVIVTPYAEGMTFTPSDYFVGTVSEGNKSTATFTLNTMSCEQEYNTVSFSASYFNGDNLHYTENTVKDVRIIKQSPLVFTAIETVSAGNKYTITGDLNNFGITDAKNVMVSVASLDGLEPVQPYANYFIGTLEADDFSSFELSARVTSGNITAIPILIEFRDPDNAYTAISQEIPIQSGTGTGTGTSFSVKNDENESSTGLWLMAGIIAIGIVAVIGYSWKKRRDEEEGKEEKEGYEEEEYEDWEDGEITEDIIDEEEFLK
ncbi:COG1361 S-layer family protein [Methanolobus sp. WCC5]|uniref:COG1361 S-layer family protein n=1 Tax=Methanolobus sp. WCC5 TaxID=3125785 RepID=UPI003245F87A